MGGDSAGPPVQALLNASGASNTKYQEATKSLERVSGVGPLTALAFVLTIEEGTYLLRGKGAQGPRIVGATVHRLPLAAPKSGL